jgi:putative DNA primase/helicase
MGAAIDHQKFDDYVPELPAGGCLDEDAREHELAALLESRLPPLKCVGSDWYTYKDGVWRRGNRDVFRPDALAVQHAKARKERMASSLLSHLESKNQVREETFSSFYKFDGEAVLINCANGVLRVTASGEWLLSHSPEYFFAGQVAAKFDSEAEAPIFGKVLQDALPDPADLALVQVFAGYMLYPSCCFEAAAVWYGDGGTGKSTVSDGIRVMLGDDLVRCLSLLQICDPKSFHLVNLRNAAVNICTELDALPIVGADNFKLLVSGEQVAADRKHQELVSLKTTCKFLFLTNYLPRFQHGTNAELRRLRFLRFERKPAKPDPTLKHRIAFERDGIFRFAIDGLRTLLVRREIPQGGSQAQETRDRFKIQNDPVAAFVRSRCELATEAEVLKNQLFSEYEEFLSEHGISKPADSSSFFRHLYNRFEGVKELKRRDGNQFIRKLNGIALREADCADCADQK